MLYLILIWIWIRKRFNKRQNQLDVANRIQFLKMILMQFMAINHLWIEVVTEESISLHTNRQSIQTAAAEPVVEEEDETVNYRLMADGGMTNDAPVYEGGIMDLESSRQMYGLGKLVKKVTRSVKKIAKSPIGKAALLYAGGSYLSGRGHLVD